MSINLTDELNAATKKGKIAAAKQVFLDGDSQNVQKEIEDINARHDSLSSKHDELSTTVSEHTTQIANNQSQIAANKSAQDAKNASLDANMAKLNTRDDQITELVKGVTATGGASVATAVSYDNASSNLDAATAQGAIDELATKKLNKTDIVQEFGDAEDKVVSQFALPFRYIQNEEFIFAQVDANDKLLFGIQQDGTPVFGKVSAVEDSLQSQVNLLADKITAIFGDDDTTSAIDTLKELRDFFANIDNTQTLTSILANLNSLNTKFGEDIKNLQDTKVDKEEGKSLIEDEVKECFKVIENEEFIKAIVDSDDKVLFGFYRATGEPYYPLNEMYHVIKNEEYFAAWLDTDDKVVLGIRRDGEIIGEIHAVNALKQVISEIQEKLDTIYSNTKELLDVFLLQENPEYLAVEKDTDGRVLSTTNPDGSHYAYNMKSETIPEEFTHIADVENRSELTLDSNNRILSYRKSDGTKYEHSFETDKLNAKEVLFSDKTYKTIDDNIKKITNIRSFKLPTFGTVNIKSETFFLTYNAGYSDKNGIYPIIINEDTDENAKLGKTLLKFYVKSTLQENGDDYSTKEDSIGLDFYVPSKVTEINGKYYVTSSLNKNDTDGSYEVVESSIRVTKIVDVPTIGAWNVDKKTEHQCIVDIDFGSFLKGTYNIGVKYQGSSTLYKRKRNFRFTFYKDSSFSKKDSIKIGEMVRTNGYNLKANYSDTSRVKEMVLNRIFIAIWEDREEYGSHPWNNKFPYSGAVGMIKGFPISVSIGGQFYGLDIFGLKKDPKNFMLSGDADGMIVSGTRGNSNDPSNWTEAKPEDWDDEMNDSLTESNKTALEKFFTFINSDSFTKDNIPDKMSVIDWIDYFICIQVFFMQDNTCRNMILYTGKDKEKFYPYLYDLDLSWSYPSYNTDIMTNAYAADMSLWQNFKETFADEIANRYEYLRKKILNVDYLQAVCDDAVQDIPSKVISQESQKWGTVRVNLTNAVNNTSRRLEWLDSLYFKIK